MAGLQLLHSRRLGVYFLQGLVEVLSWDVQYLNAFLKDLYWIKITMFLIAHVLGHFDLRPFL